MRGRALPALALTVFGPIAEELFFRGFVFRRLLSAWGAGAAYALSALMFGAAHASDESDKTLEVGAFGAILAAAYHLSGFRLWVPIVLHGVSNALVTGTYLCVSPQLSHEQRQRALHALFRVRRAIITLSYVIGGLREERVGGLHATERIFHVLAHTWQVGYELMVEFGWSACAVAAPAPAQLVRRIA